jgi:hypothetical protein
MWRLTGTADSSKLGRKVRGILPGGSPSTPRPQEMLEKMPREGIDKKEGLVLFSGTIPTRERIIFGDSYDLELEDPVLKRSIKHGYRVKILPQYV